MQLKVQNAESKSIRRNVKAEAETHQDESRSVKAEDETYIIEKSSTTK